MRESTNPQTLPHDQLADLERQVEEYRLLFDCSPVMFWYKDLNNTTILVNQAAANLEGTTVEAISGKSSWDLYPKEQADAFYRDDMEVLTSGKPKLGIVEQHTSVATGEKLWLQTGKVPYRDAEGRIIGVVAFAVDITEQKRVEEVLQQKQRQLARTNEIFRATLDHLTDALHRGAHRDEVLQYLDMMRKQFDTLG